MGVSAVDVYEVSDFYLAAYLKVAGLKLVRVENDFRRTVYVFADRADREVVVNSYFNDGSVRISPFVHAMRDLNTYRHHG